MKNIQKKIKDFCEKYNLKHSPEHHLLDAISEMGEVAKELLKMTDYGEKPLEFRNEIKGELGDVMYSLITLANHFDIDLESALDMVLNKYEARLKKGSAGSEND